MIIVLAIATSLLPAESFGPFVYRLAPLFGHGEIHNLTDVVTSFIRASKLFYALGAMCICLGVVVAYLRSLSNRPKETVESQTFKLIDFERKDYWLIVSICIFLFLSIPTLNQSLWWDEAWTMQYVHGSWLNLLAPNEGNNHIFSTFLIKLISKIFGETEWTVRLPALTFGVTTVTGIFFVSKKLWESRLIINLTTLFASTSYGVVFCSINARGYAIVLAASVWLGFFLLSIDYPRKEVVYICYVIIGLVAVLTLPTAVIILAGFIVSIVFVAITNKSHAREAINFINLTLLIGFICLLIYAWSLPVRVMFMAARVPATGGVFRFVVLKFSYWGMFAGNFLCGLIILLASVIGVISLYFRERKLAIYLTVCIAGAILIQIRSGFSSFWYSSLGLIFIPLTLGESLNVIVKCISRYLTPAFRAPLIVAALIAALFVTGNIISVSRLWAPRSRAREIAAMLSYYQERRSYPFEVIGSVTPLRYYFEKKHLYYESASDASYSNLKKISIDNEANRFEVILFHGQRSEMPSLLFQDKHYIEFGGWADEYTVFYQPELDSLLEEDLKDNNMERAILP